VLHPRRELRFQPEPQLLVGGRELARQDQLQGRQPVEAPVPRLVNDPHATATDLGQDLLVPDLTGRPEDHRFGRGISDTLGGPGRVRPPQRADRRAAPGRVDQRLLPERDGFLQPRLEGIGGGQLIDAATTFGTVAEVGRDASERRIPELTQRQRTQLFGGRVGRRRLEHGKPCQDDQRTRISGREKTAQDGEPYSA
jgi:hypothetical protein